MKIETENYFIWLSATFKVMLAKCKKTGRFVKRAIAAIEYKMQDAVNQFACGMALVACIAALPSAVAYMGFESLQVSMWIWLAFMLFALLALPLKILKGFE